MTGAQGIKTLVAVHDWCSEGMDMPIDFYASILICPPKGATPNTTIEKHWDETRPLSLKNTDSKLIAAAQSWTLRPWIKKEISNAQRGFVPTAPVAGECR